MSILYRLSYDAIAQVSTIMLCSQHQLFIHHLSIPDITTYRAKGRDRKLRPWLSMHLAGRSSCFPPAMQLSFPEMLAYSTSSLGGWIHSRIASSCSCVKYRPRLVQISKTYQQPFCTQIQRALRPGCKLNELTPLLASSTENKIIAVLDCPYASQGSYFSPPEKPGSSNLTGPLSCPELETLTTLPVPLVSFPRSNTVKRKCPR
jgi:hypothetical protein